MGDGSNLVTVSCSNHHETLVSGLWQSLVGQRDLDTHLRWSGRTVTAHRLVADVFLSSVTDTTPVPASAPGPDGEGSPATSPELEFLLEFLYRGSVTVPADALPRLLDVAKGLQFKMLINAIVEMTGLSEGDDKRETLPGRKRLRSSAALRMTRKRLSEAKITSDDLKIVNSHVRSTKNVSRMQRSKISATTPLPQYPSLQTDDQCSLDKESNSCLTEGTRRRSTRKATIRSKNEKDSVTRRRKSTAAARSLAEKQDFSLPSFGCDDCDKKFPSESARDLHQLSHSQDPRERHRCLHCDYKTGSLNRFQIHQSKHDPDVTIVRCNYCTKKFIDQQSLSRHKCVVMAGANLYSCSECEYRTVHWVRFRVHLAARHDPSIQIYRCSTCRRPFLSEELRSEHRCKRVGADLTLHPCAECKFIAKCASQLRYHVQAMHSIVKAFKCQVRDCSYETGRKSSLKRHVAVTHHDIRKFVCEICGHRAVTRQKLDKHCATHTGLKPLCCAYCQARFTDASTLKSHVQRHVNYERPYVCHVCGSGFNRRDNLRVHLRNVHKTEMTPTNK